MIFFGGNTLYSQTGRCLFPQQYINDSGFQDSCSGTIRFTSDLVRCDTSNAVAGYYFLEDSAVQAYWQGGVWTGSDHSVGGQSRVLFATVYPGNQWIKIWSQTVVPDSAGDYEFSFYSLFPNQNIQHIPSQFMVVLQNGMNTPDTQMIQVNPISGSWQFQLADFNLITNDSTILSIYTLQDAGTDWYLGIDDVSFRRVNGQFSAAQILSVDTTTLSNTIILTATSGFVGYQWNIVPENQYFRTNDTLHLPKNAGFQYAYLFAEDTMGCWGRSNIEMLVIPFVQATCEETCHTLNSLLFEEFGNGFPCNTSNTIWFGSDHVFANDLVNGSNCNGYNLISLSSPMGLCYLVQNANLINSQSWLRSHHSTPLNQAFLIGDPWDWPAHRIWFEDITLAVGEKVCVNALVSNVENVQNGIFIPVVDIRVSDSSPFNWPGTFTVISNPVALPHSNGWVSISGTFMATVAGTHRIAIVNNATIPGNDNGLGRNLAVDRIEIKSSIPIIVNASIQNGQTIVCTGDNVTIPVSITGGAAPWTINYTIGNSQFNATTNQLPYLISFNPNQSTSVILNSVVTADCTYSGQGTIQVQVDQPANASISSDQTICQGDAASLTVGLSGGNGFWQFTYTTNGQNPQVISSTASPYVLSVSPTSTTTYEIIQIISGVCTTSITSRAIVTVIPTPTGSISSNQTICQGDLATISINLGGGSGVWTFSYTNGTNTLTQTANTSPYIIQVSPGSTQTYTLNYVESQGCTTMVGNSIVVTVLPIPDAQFQDFGTICLGQQFPVNVVLTGTGPWAISYTDGISNFTITGITNNPYLLNLSPSQSSTYTISSVQDMHCTVSIAEETTVDVLPLPNTSITGNQSICQGNSAWLTLNLSGNNGPWQIHYTEGSTPQVIGPITSNPYVFSVSPSITTTYTLTQVQENICSVNLSQSVVVQAYPIPTAAFSGHQSICIGNSATLTVNFTGNAPWDFTYTDGVSNYTITGITSNPYSFPVTPTSTTAYNVVSVQDLHCLGNGFISVTNVFVSSIPTVSLQSDQTICNGQSATMSIQVNGTDPWDFTYTDGTSSITISGITSNPHLLTVSPSNTTTYSITSVYQGCQVNVQNQQVKISIIPKPTAQVAANQTICHGSAPRITLTLTGTPVWSFSYLDGTTVIPVTGISNSPYFFNVSPSQTTTYTISGLTDLYCQNAQNVQFVVHVVPVPGVSLSATQTLCSGTTGQLTMNLTGIPTWQVDYTDGVNNLTQTGNTSPFIISVTPTISTTYSIIQVVSAPCTVSISAEASIKVYDIPSVTFSNDQTICHGDGAVLTVKQASGATPWSFSWTDGTTTTLVTGQSSNPYLISVSPTTTTTYTLHSISDPFCSSSASQQVVITVIPRPSISVHANIHNVCLGDIFATPIYFSGPPAPWTLEYTDGSSPVVSVLVTASPYMFSITATGNLFYTLTPYYNGCQGLGDYFIVNVPPKPKLSLSNNQKICAGNSANITLSLTGSQPWSIEYSEGTNPVHQYIQTSSTPYILSVTPTATTTWYFHSVSDANNCGDVYAPPKQVVVTVVPLPIPDLGADQTICLDPANPTSIILEDSNLPITHTYLWSTGQNSHSIQVSPSVTTTYSVQVTEGFGCVGSDIITIYVAPLPTISVSHSLDCNTGCYDYTAIASSPMFNTFTYIWSLDDAGMNNVQIPGSSTGTSDVIVHWCLGGQNYYSAHVYAIDPLGCKGYNMMVVPHIDENKMLGEDMLICPVPTAAQPAFLGSDILSSLGPLYSFSWTGPNGFTSNQANPILNLLGGEEGIYSLTLNSPENCIYYNEVYIDVCCLQPTAGIPETTYILNPGDVLSSTTLSNSTVWVRGLLDVDGRSKLDASDVRMKQGAEIRIPATTQPNPTLPGYNQLIIDNSHIHADCSIMWSTIRVLDDINYNDEPGGLVVINNSLIEDAQTAVSSISGGNFFIQNSTLNANNIQLHLHGWGGHVNQMHRSVLDEATLSCSRPLIAPYAGRRTEIGISVSNMNLADRMVVNYGFPHSGYAYENQYNLTGSMYRNRISDCDQGISAHQTDLMLQNFDFKDISGPHAFTNPLNIPPFNEKPTAIRFQGNSTWLRIFESSFDNIWHGIVSAEPGRSVIYNNQMNRIMDRGVSIYDAIGGSLQLVESNTIEHWSSGTGVLVIRSNPFTDIRITGNTIRNNKVAILTENNSTSFLNIGGNDIFNPGPINFPSSLFNVGIWVNEPNLSTSFIGHNIITSRYYGIHTFGGPVINERIHRNRVELVRNLDGSGFNAANYGIVVRDRNTPLLNSNYVKGLGISQQLSSASRLRGITLENNDNPFAHCNEMDNTYTGMIAMGDNTTADLQRNIMRPARVGFLFKDNGQVGAQGSLTQTNDNEWHCPFTTSALRAENSVFASLSPFYVQQNISPFDPNLCANVVSSSSALLTSIPVITGTGSTGSSTIDCDSNYFLRVAESDSSSEFEDREVFDLVYGPDTLSEELISWYHLLVLDSLDFGIYPEYNRLISRLHLYRKLVRYETLRETDSIFNSFYTIADSGTEKFISSLLNAVGNNNIEDGVELLSEWTPSNATEEAWWNWFEISFRLRENSSDTLSSGLKDSIVYYASMCPDALGYPVYAARTILMRMNLDTLIEIHECENWTFADEIDSSEINYDNPENTILSIYPNPANIEVSFEHDLEETEDVRIKVYDSMGNLRLNEAFGTSQRTLVWDTSLEITGMYYVLLLQDDVLIESKSLAIIH